MSTHTDLLARELRERSEQMAGTTLDPDAVRGRARSIQRRRRAATGLVAAAVLAIATPLGLNLTDTLDSRPLPPAQQTQSPDPDRTDNAAPEPDPKPVGTVPADGAGAPRGAGPGIGYLTDGMLHTADGEEIGFGRQYWQVTPYAEGWLATQFDPAVTYQLDAAGGVLDSWPGGDIAVRPDGQMLATVLNATGGIDVQLRPVSGTASPLSATVAFEGMVDIVGFVGPEEIAYELTRPGGAVEVYLTDFLHEPRRIDGALGMAGANPATGRISVLTSIDELEPGSCSAVLTGAGERLWETCDYTLEAFSPDGRYVLGTDAYHDGIGGSTVAILDAADGTVLAHFTTRDLGFTNQAVWESDSSVLLTTFQGENWYMLRLQPDGTVEQALDPVQGDEMSRPWALSWP